ncbi:MAG: hypothetical protein K8S94_17170 [Planctomycetia bacterium]|nr:hypothetical protein [Planctomycetia bacterium]
MINHTVMVALILSALAAGIADAAPPTIVAAPRNVGPATAAHSRTWRHRRSTVRAIRRTPEVMREDAARIKRGDLFSSWSTAAAN